MVTFGPRDVQATKEGFMKAFDYYKGQNLPNQEAYHRAVALCEYNGVLPPYTSFESFKTSALYEKKAKK